MAYRYCPSCESEYREGFTHCSDCGVELVDGPPAADPPGAAMEGGATGLGPHPVQVYVSGGDMRAQVVRSMLEGHDVYAEVWSSGLGVWHRAAALTPLTGIPNDFGAYRVMVRSEDEEAARELIVGADETGEETD